MRCGLAARTLSDLKLRGPSGKNGDDTVRRRRTLRIVEMVHCFTDQPQHRRPDPRPRRAPSVAGAIGLALILLSHPARAQSAPLPAPIASDADRLNARDLFDKGLELQQKGRWAEALLAFQRAQVLFSAPTNMLHIAQCLAQLGRLIEAEETYHGLASLALPKDAPAPFVAAATQGAAELQQVQALIPKLRIEVTPSGIANLTVTLDQQPVNLLLLDTDRLVDPGSHTVKALAPGYAPKEAVFTVREKEARVVVLALQPLEGVAPAPVMPPAAPVIAPQPAPAIAPEPQPQAAPPVDAMPNAPRGMVRVTFVTAGPARSWSVLDGERTLCTTPCTRIQNPDVPVAMRLIEEGLLKDRVTLLGADLRPYGPGPLTVAVHPRSDLELVGGLLATTFGGIGQATGIPLMSVGCSQNDTTMCRAGVITTAVTAFLLAAGISLMVDAGARLEVRPATVAVLR
jgi:hypothetical protein